MKKLSVELNSYCTRCRSYTNHLVVKSRAKGFVTQDCLECGKPAPVGLPQLPPLVCLRCGKQFVPKVNGRGNYEYECSGCHARFVLADWVPVWNEHFYYDGFAVDSDCLPAPAHDSDSADLI